MLRYYCENSRLNVFVDKDMKCNNSKINRHSFICYYKFYVSLQNVTISLSCFNFIQIVCSNASSLQV